MDDATLHAIEALGDAWQRATTYGDMTGAVEAAIRTELGAPSAAVSPVLGLLLHDFVEMAISPDHDAEVPGVHVPENAALCRAFLVALERLETAQGLYAMPGSEKE